MFSIVLLASIIWATSIRTIQWDNSLDFIVGVWNSNEPLLLRGGPALILEPLENIYDANEPTVSQQGSGSESLRVNYESRGTALGFRDTILPLAQPTIGSNVTLEYSEQPWKLFLENAQNCGKPLSKQPLKSSPCYYLSSIVAERLSDGRFVAEPNIAKKLNIGKVTPGDLDSLGDNWAVNLFVASALDTVTAPHYDVDANLFFHITGPKTFYILPPRWASHLGVYPNFSTRRRQLIARTIRDESTLDPIVAELNPGDYLYIPPYWVHEVFATGGAISASLAIWAKPGQWNSNVDKASHWGSENVLRMEILDFLKEEWSAQQRFDEARAFLWDLMSAEGVDYPKMLKILARRLFFAFRSKEERYFPGRFRCLFSRELKTTSNVEKSQEAVSKVADKLRALPRTVLVDFAEALLIWATNPKDVIDINSICDQCSTCTANLVDKIKDEL